MTSMATILAVDDEEPTRVLVKRLLSLHGHSVDTVDDGAAAIDQLQKKHCDLMIIDIPMVTLTSATKDIGAAYEVGIDGYVIKPFDMKNLFEKVEKTLLK